MGLGEETMNIVNGQFKLDEPGFDFNDSIKKIKNVLNNKIDTLDEKRLFITNSFFFICHNFKAILIFKDEKLVKISFKLYEYNDSLEKLDEIKKCIEEAIKTSKYEWDISCEWDRDHYFKELFISFKEKNIYDDVHRIVENEINSNNIHDLLIGTNGKRFVNEYDPQDLPTDYVMVLKAIHNVYSNNKNDNYIKLFEKTIEQLLNGNELEIYSACYYLFIQMMYEHENKANFKINRNLLTVAKEKVENRKSELSKYKEYFGKEYANGVYGDILRLYRVYNRNINFNRLKINNSYYNKRGDINGY